MVLVSRCRLHFAQNPFQHTILYDVVKAFSADFFNHPGTVGLNGVNGDKECGRHIAHTAFLFHVGIYQAQLGAGEKLRIGLIVQAVL